METISNLAGVASKAIWGEPQAEEPVSGKQGAGTVQEPFDKGNDESITSANASTEPKTPAGVVGSTPGNTASTAGVPEHNEPPVSGIDSDKNRNGPSEAQPSDTVGDPKSAQTPKTKQQGAGNPTEIPTDDKGKPAMPHTDSQREALVMKGEFPHDPNDHSGEPLKMHDGTEKGEIGGTKDDPRDDGKKDRSASVSQEGGGPHGEKKGTGEKVVKATGLAADGGDFDATKPGAGQEATRLAEEKGIKSDHKPPGAPTETSSPGGSDSAKVSKMQKLKEKLHMGTGKKLDK